MIIQLMTGSSLYFYL